MTGIVKIERHWAKLWDILNAINDCVNARTPITGDGINITESPNGFIIALKRDQPAQQKEPHDLVNELIWHTVKWQDVTVVDPSTCAQSNLKVLVNTGDFNDSVVIDVADASFWVTRKSP